VNHCPPPSGGITRGASGERPALCRPPYRLSAAPHRVGRCWHGCVLVGHGRSGSGTSPSPPGHPAGRQRHRRAARCVDDGRTTVIDVRAGTRRALPPPGSCARSTLGADLRTPSMPLSSTRPGRHRRRRPVSGRSLTVVTGSECSTGRPKLRYRRVNVTCLPWSPANRPSLGCGSGDLVENHHPLGGGRVIGSSVVGSAFGRVGEARIVWRGEIDADALARLGCHLGVAGSTHGVGSVCRWPREPAPRRFPTPHPRPPGTRR
jgi:hypothetical protein